MNPEIEELEDALENLLKGIQEALQNGEFLSEDLQRQVAQDIEYLTTELDKLYSIEANEPPPITTIEEEEAAVADQVAPSPPEVPPSPPTGGQVPELEQAMPSSNISAFNYDPETQNLYVQFLGDHPNRHGSTYQYSGVPEQIFEIFRKGAIPASTNGQNKWGKWWKGKKPSIGSAMYHLIKNSNYPYQRIS